MRAFKFTCILLLLFFFYTQASSEVVKRGPQSLSSCSSFFLDGSSATNQTTSTIASMVYKPLIFADVSKALAQIGTDWSAGTANTIEIIYAPTDNLGGTFLCRWTMNQYHVINSGSVALPAAVSLGVATGGACADGDEVSDFYGTAGILAVWTSVAGANQITLADGDRVCLMATTFDNSGGTIDFRSTGFSLECRELSVTAGETTCYH